MLAYLQSACLCFIIVEDVAKLEVWDGVACHRHADQVFEPTHFAHQKVVVVCFPSMWLLEMLPQCPTSFQFELLTNLLFGVILDFRLVLGRARCSINHV